MGKTLLYVCVVACSTVLFSQFREEFPENFQNFLQNHSVKKNEGALKVCPNETKKLERSYERRSLSTIPGPSRGNNVKFA